MYNSDWSVKSFLHIIVCSNCEAVQRAKQTILIVVRQLYCCVTAFLWASVIVVRQRHFGEAATLLWGSLILGRQPHCCEAASLIWGRLIVVSYPHCCEVAALLWGSLISVRQPHCCDGDYFFEATWFIGQFIATFSAWISSFMVPQSPHSGSASMLAVLATFYNSAWNSSD